MTIIEAIAHFRSEAAKAVTDGTRDLNNQVAETGNGYYEEVYSCVTNWMPLPELPAENDRPDAKDGAE